MLEQEKVSANLDNITLAMSHIWDAELDINKSIEPLIAFTWSPNPKIIKYDLNRANQHFIDIVFQYFYKCFDYYVVIPEISTDGRLHYHGWYTSMKDRVKYYRFIYPKLKKLGMYRTKEIYHYKCGDYDSQMNGLYYYKKDICENVDIFDQYIMSHLVPPNNSIKNKVAKKKIRNLAELQQVVAHLEYEPEQVIATCEDFFTRKSNVVKDYDEFMLKNMRNKYKK